MIISDKTRKMLIGIVILFLTGIVLYGIQRHSTVLERDGFKVVEEHETYMLVEKDGHQYIATEVGMYHLSWNYEHYPNCPCEKIKEG